ncbi:hypothetical protein J2766_003399 [Agrobacterium tumefaciens]|uniref:hypothetical protein n=1 Tax=Agrobacterium tumefaciens TaxID=358 RepID=UPI001AEA55BC|nr:hypothetical protein [Agrobacterium tumefaciens]MBP2566802.1 hypothetical protein [Agrobacterium tumefaciens]
MSFGLADEVAAAGDALFSPVFGTGQDGSSVSDRYNANLQAQRATDESDSADRGGYRLAGQIIGGVTGGLGLAKNGLSLAANAAEAGKGLGRVTAASAGDGLILGAAQGFGSGEGVDGRIQGALKGGGTGLLLGGATPLAVAGVSKVAKTAAAPLMARLYPENYATDAVATALRRSGKSPDEISAILQSAQDAGQDMYNVADALGVTGQRLASTVARNPHDKRQAFIDALRFRQAGQGDRLANALTEGFDASDTAAQRTASLTAARDAEANSLYGAARRAAGAANVTPILEHIDETISPGVNQIVSPRDRIANDSIEGALSRVRSMLSDGNSQVTDFNTLFRAKLDLDDMIARADAQGAGNRAFALNQVKRRVDAALEEASPAFRTANDTFRTRSGVIDAVAEGGAATSGRQRAADTIDQFGRLTPDQQGAFRVGYADPLIAKVEAMSSSPTTNKARVLTTPKFEQEFPVVAAPGRATELGQRIGREQRMFDTAFAALGGSKTADNIADAIDMNKVDPGVIASLLRRDVTGAIMHGVGKAINEVQGMPPSVIQRISKILLETSPQGARDLLTAGNEKLTRSDQLRAKVVSALLNSGAAGAGRL